MLDRNAMSDRLERARKAGLAPEWIDASGRHQTVAPDTLHAVLDAFGGYETQEAAPVEQARCSSVHDAVPGGRATAIAVQLYSLRGSDGFGDLGALARFAQALGPLGVDAVAVSPIHAPFLSAPDDISPYAPSSRLFLNPLYAADDTPDDGQDGLVDWPRAARAKLAKLRERFSPAPEPDARLRDHARFEALDAHFREQGLYRWQDWPAA